VYDFMGLLECSPTSDGAAAVVMCSEEFLDRHPQLKPQAVHIVGAQLGTDLPSAFSENSCIKVRALTCMSSVRRWSAMTASRRSPRSCTSRRASGRMTAR